MKWEKCGLVKGNESDVVKGGEKEWWIIFNDKIIAFQNGTLKNLHLK